MSFLLVVSVGPVQSFIAAARRTRDLWGGSLLLSELSKAVALSIHNSSPGSLIFPSPPNPPTDLARSSEFLAANIILAEITNAALDPKAVALSAIAAAETAWLSYVKEAFDQVGPFVDLARWEYQRANVLEIYAAWESVIDPSQYPAARSAVMRRIAARKSCRDFSPWQGVALVPKSSLDGARESVWNPAALAEMPAHLCARLRLSRQEQLDVIGLTKRLGLGTQQFPSVSRIAAEDWLHRLDGPSRELLSQAANSLVPHGLARLNFHRFPQFQQFPFEGAMVFASRLREFQEPTDPQVKQALSRVVRQFGEPSPYLAVLLADGDRMGATLSKIESPEEHRRFSAALASFASSAAEIVRTHRGALVYSGGDDVLAMLPLSTALECASRLRQSFSSFLAAWDGPTLSVGITIGHAMEDLEEMLARARRAEHYAKEPDRNGLALHYSPRNQIGRTIRLRWKESPSAVGDDAHEEMLRLQGFFADNELPDKAAFEISLLARHYRGWSTSNPDLPNALRADTRRILRRKGGVPSNVSTWLHSWIDARVFTAADLLKIADQLVIAQHLAQQVSRKGLCA